MKKSGLTIVYICLFFALCLLPALGMAVLGPSPLLANESAPRTPALISRDGTLNTGVLADVSNYAETRFAFRPYLVSVRSFLYEKLLHTSAEPQVVAIHAGLECGLLAEKLPGLDCVSIGPQMLAIHTAEERMSVSSMARTWEFVKAILKDKG